MLLTHWKLQKKLLFLCSITILLLCRCFAGQKSKKLLCSIYSASKMRREKPSFLIKTEKDLFASSNINLETLSLSLFLLLVSNWWRERVTALASKMLPFLSTRRYTHNWCVVVNTARFTGPNFLVKHWSCSLLTYSLVIKKAVRLSDGWCCWLTWMASKQQKTETILVLHGTLIMLW